MAAHRLWCFLLMSSVLQVCDATGMFYFRMKSYSSSCKETFSKCDIMFTFCFDRPRNNPSLSTCEYKKTVESGVYDDTNSITFGSNIKGIPNPMYFGMNQFVDPRVLVVVRLMEYNTIESNKHIITTFSIISFTPAASLATASYEAGQFSDSGHTFRYEYKAFCDPDYYTRACNVFCEASDTDLKGHYSCSNAGNKVCLSGWEGPSCKSDKDECQSTPDICGNITSSATNTSAPKVCVNTAGSYRCDCPPGLKGDDCDQDVNECEEVSSPPCSNGGTCSNTVGSYSCLCPSTWGGATCTDDVDECSTMTSPCTFANSHCSNTIGGYQCTCDEGWTGDFCTEDVDECTYDNVTCYNNGSCINVPGGYRCACSPGWTGANCTVDVNECEGKQQPCLDDAQCDNLEGHFQCVCVNGTVGCQRGPAGDTGSTTGGYTGGTRTGQSSAVTQNEQTSFLWWPLLLALLVLIVIIVIIALLLIRRRRKRMKPTRSRPPSAIEVQHFHTSSLMFENHLYHTSKNRPQSTASDLETRAPMPLPESSEPKSDIFQDDLVIYHDLDEQTLQKTGTSADTTPKEWPQQNGEANAYANGHVVLDVRPHAGEGNQYEDFEALKHKADRPTPRAGYEDMEGYMLPSTAGSFKESPKPLEYKAAILPRDRVADQVGYINPAFQTDEALEALQNAHALEDIQIDEILETDEEEWRLPTAPPVPYSDAGFYEEKKLGDQETPDFLKSDFSNEPENSVDWAKRNELSHGMDNLWESDMLRTPEDATDHSKGVHGDSEQLHTNEGAVGHSKGFHGDTEQLHTDEDEADHSEGFHGDTEQLHTDEDEADHSELVPGEPEQLHSDDDCGLKFVGIRHGEPAEEDHLDLDVLGETTTDDIDLPPPPSPEELVWLYPEHELARDDPVGTGYL